MNFIKCPLMTAPDAEVRGQAPPGAVHHLYVTCWLQAIVAAPLTVTGSIGVVTGKFNLADLYERVGYAKTILSRGKFAEFLAADNR